MADDLTDLIEQAAAEPASVNVSANASSAQSRPLPEVIEADKHLAAQRSTASPTFGMRLAKLQFPGAG